MRDETEKSFVGYWYTPDNPELEIPGTLFVNEGNATLELMGSFKSIIELLEFKHENFPIILGTTSEERNITLQNCFQSTASIGNINKQKFKINGPIYMGISASDGKPPLFNQLSLELENLQNWVGHTGFSYSYSLNNEKTLENIFSLNYSRPKSIDFELNNAKIAIEANFHNNILPRYKINCSQTYSIKILVKEMITAEDFFENYIRPLQAFFTFFMGYTCNIEKTVFFNPDITVNLKEKSILVPINTTLPLIKYRPKPVDTMEMLISYDDISADFKAIVKKWFDMYEKIRLILELFVNINNYSYLEHRFSNAISALEGFHRTFLKNELESVEAFKLKVDNIVSTTEPQYKKIVADALKYKNEPNLRNRLHDLFPKTDPVLYPLVDNYKRFINEVVSKRNDMSHSKNNGHTNLRNKNLYFDTLMLMLILKINILRELIDSKTANEFIKNDQLYKLISYNR